MTATNENKQSWTVRWESETGIHDMKMHKFEVHILDFEDY